MSDDRIPVEHVLPGMGLHPLPDKWTPLEAFVLIKCMSDEGDSTFVFRTTNPLNLEELLGALTVQTDLLRKRLADRWDTDDEED